MKKSILNIALATFIFAGVFACKEKTAEVEEVKEVAQATETSSDFNLNVASSSITWKGSKPLGSHSGTIKLASGAIAIKDGSIEAGKFSIDMNSIANLDEDGKSNENLEAHLKGTVEGKEGDFFNVNEYPFSVFELTNVSEKDGKTMIGGNLTIKDKTNNIEFPARIILDDYKLMLKSEPFTIDRTKWGVNYGSKSVFDNLGDKFIDDEMEITISIVADKS